jgi:hypothetical protein
MEPGSTQIWGSAPGNPGAKNEEEKHA